MASTGQKLHLFIICGRMSHSSVGVRFKIYYTVYGYNDYIL
jgi:hypothetical protein